MSSLTIMLLTYNRLDYAKATIASVLRFIRSEKYDLRVHIASDGDTDAYINELENFVIEMCANLGQHINSLTFTVTDHESYGASYNLATQVVHDYPGYVLVLEDDWELRRELDADLFIEALDELEAGCMRLGYLGFTQPLRAEFASSHGRLWLRLDPASAEPHVFAGHPRIESIAWQRSVGPWPEGLEPGQTEFAVAHIAESRHGVIWPVQEVKPYGDLFVHIGAERSW